MEEIVMSASNATQLDTLVNLGWGNLVAVGFVIGCLFGFAFFKGWLI